MRAFLLVMDSVGIGFASDASRYGDEGADTIGHIAEACARGDADNHVRQGVLHVPNLLRMGLGEACRLASGRAPTGFNIPAASNACWGCAAEISKGKDTPSGHWELAGAPVPFEWGYFPRTTPCFPIGLTNELCDRAGLPGILGNCHASGTEIIGRLGREHIESNRPICYTSADSVFQIAAHEEAFGLAQLYRVCEIARELVNSLNVGRVIARPFIGSADEEFTRTANRKDYSVPPPTATLLDFATAQDRDIVTVGKIDDIFAHRGTGRVMKGNGNDALFDRTLDGIDQLDDGGLLFANFIDFDTLYGHRRDIAGYAAALEAFDRRLNDLLPCLKTTDLLVITADHGCDPSWPGTDHTREQVPVLVLGGNHTGSIGVRASYADVGATIAAHLRLPSLPTGVAF